MLQLARWKIILVALSVLVGVLFTLPNMLPASTVQRLPGVLQQRLNLGLDLQGGSYLLLDVDVAALRKERLSNLLEDVRSTLRSERIAYTGLALRGSTVSVRITDPGQVERAREALNRLGAPGTTGVRTLSVAGGGDQTLTATLSEEALAQAEQQAVEQSIEIIRRRVDELGTREPSIARQGRTRIVVQAPGESDPEQLKRVIGQTAKLTFQMVDDTASAAEAQAGRTPPGSVLLPQPDNPGEPFVLVKRRVLVSGENLVDAQVGFDQTQKPAIDFRFDGPGARRFGQATSGENVGKRFAIILDEKVISAPQIIEPITGGSGQITGGFTQEAAAELAGLLRAGALPAPLTVEEQRTVGAELGQDAIDAGLISTVLGLVLVLIFMVAVYGLLFGGIALIALTVNGLLIVAAMSLTGASLTLPGIAGLILTLAVAVDANVLIYERMRDEARAGRGVIAAMDAGFNRATITIFDANITHLGVAAIMFALGAGPVKGFAWTLFIGVFTSVFTAVMITQVLLAWWFKTARPKTLPIADGVRPMRWPLIKILPQKTSFRFVRPAKVLGGLAVLLCVGSLVATLFPLRPPCGGLNCGVDFRGGTVLELSTAPRPADVGAIRSALNAQGLGDVQVQAFGAPTEALVRFETPAGQNPTQAVGAVKERLSQAIGGAKFSRTEVVGPRVSGELLWSGVLALLAATVLVLVYVWFRFGLTFGAAAIAALTHDVILTFGLFAVTRMEFTLTSIAAILTIIGYSINDKIVTLDRVRENLRKFKRMPLAEVIDLSLNETLSRTIITGATGIMALVVLAFFGGEALFAFSVSMIFGIVVGTYSSVYISAPLLTMLGVKRGEPGESAPPPSRTAAVARP
jgi:SecD/SecF fusion protein